MSLEKFEGLAKKEMIKMIENQTWFKKLSQDQKFLNLLRVKPMTNRELWKWSNSPQKCIQTLRKKGHDIVTRPIKGESYSEYVLVKEGKNQFCASQNAQEGVLNAK